MKFYCIESTVDMNNDYRTIRLWIGQTNNLTAAGVMAWICIVAGFQPTDEGFLRWLNFKESFDKLLEYENPEHLP
jgi:hypothetical protein